jgi:hypothetical protein
VADKELVEQVRTMVAAHLAAGFGSPDAIPRYVIDMLGDQHPAKELRRVVKEVLSVAVRERARAMAKWPPKTDCDRLDAAFEELNQLGVMARHNWTCCGTCGCAEVPEEFSRLRGRWQGRPIIGFAFYHNQDTESAVGGHGIYLNFGSCENFKNQSDYARASVAVGRAIVEVLKKHRLRAKWNGKNDQRINVPMKWRRRAEPKRFREGDRYKRSGVLAGRSRRNSLAC